MRALGRDTFTQLANEAARVLRDGTVKLPYRHVIIDEAQDLHPAQWRLLRAAVPAGPDDMFIVGDAHQRIYDNHVSLARVGVNVRGRSKRLTVNYRTTQEILALAVPALGKASVTGLDDESGHADRLPVAAARPPARGRRGADAGGGDGGTRAAGDAPGCDEGIEPHAIGIAARSSGCRGRRARHSRPTGSTRSRCPRSRRANAVRVGTMHGMKGLEFQAVAVIGVADGIVPAPSALTTPTKDDPVAHAQDLQRERCLLFVALTRARDHLYISYSGSPSAFLG